MGIIEKLRCVHDWEKMHEHTGTSAYEQVVKSGAIEVQGMGPAAFRKSHIVIYSCTKCGKIKEFKLN